MVNYEQLKENYIQKIIREKPDMNCLYINLQNNTRWPSEKCITDLSQSEREEVNLVKQLPNEIILDVEEKYRLYDIQSKIEERKWSYELYDTGSRGIHFSLKFSNLADKELELRNRIRKYIIQLFRTDEKLAKENQWVAMPWAKHIKTGKEKTLIDSVNSNEVNIIPNEIITYCIEDIEKQKRKQIESKEIVKNFHLNDPYLKYFMENIVENGDRNNIILKNLGIGLSQSGLTREEMEPYVQQIISNMPGKTTSEFWGWIDKGLQGEMIDYNKSEMIQWSIAYGHPVLYKLEGEEELVDFYSIKQLWNRIWNSKIAKQPVWKELCFYNMLGTVLDEKEKDYRVHLIFSSYSTSGKDEGINLVREILERLDFKARTPAMVTDRTLIGAVNPTAIEYNTRHGLTCEEPVKGQKVFKEPVEKGWLEDTDWIAFSESESVFRPSVHNKQIQIILRQAMDKARRVEKGVAGHDIPILTNTSFILTTYKMDNIVNAILHNGLFQRAIFYLKDITSEDHRGIRNHIIEKNFDSDYEDDFDEEKYIMKLLEKLREMKRWYDENKNNIKKEKRSGEFIKQLVDMTEDNYIEYMQIDKEILDSMIRREINHLHKLCVLDAISRKECIITKQTIRKCFNLIMVCIDSIKVLIANQDRDKKIKFSILKLLSIKGSMPTMQLHYELENKFKIKQVNKRSNIIKQLINLNLISSYKSGKKTMLMLTEEGRDWIDMNEM